VTTETQFDQIERKSIDDLMLDPENPRLPSSVNTENEREIIEYIVNETDIETLMQSIANNDFFPGEPIIIVPAKDIPGKFHVVEGNRRLTAVKLLNNPSLLGQANMFIENIVANANFTPNTLPVVTHQTRDEVLPYLGFRHISGVKEWEPLAKAKYIKQLFDHTNPNDETTNRYFKVGQQVGSNKGYVKRALDALAAYKIIDEHDFYEIPDLKEKSIKFAVLSTAIADENIGKFLGFSIGEENKPTHPILRPETINQDNLKDLVHWLYEKVPGARDKKPKARVPESRSIRELSCVVSNPKALRAFQDGATLQTAYQMTEGVRDEFAELVYKADAIISEAVSLVTSVEFDEDLLNVIRRIYKNTELVGKALREKEDGSAF